MNTFWRWGTVLFRGTVLFTEDGAKNIPFTNCRWFWLARLPSRGKIWSWCSIYHFIANAFLSSGGSHSIFAFFQCRTLSAMIIILSKFCNVALRKVNDNSTKCPAFCRSSLTKWAYPTFLSTSPKMSLCASLLAPWGCDFFWRIDGFTNMQISVQSIVAFKWPVCVSVAKKIVFFWLFD